MMSNNNNVAVDSTENDEKLEGESNKKQRQVKVLVVKDKVHQKIYTLDVPLYCNELDTVYTIFLNEKVLKDSLVCEMAGEFTLRVTDIHDPKSTYQYMVEVQSPTISSRVRMIAVNDPKRPYQYMIEVESPTVKSPEFDNFGKLLNSKTFSDVTLHVMGQDIHAHKIILANKSSVFEAMFAHEMHETISNKIEIKDICYDIMCDFLHFVYTGKLRDDYTNDVFARYSNLLIAANKYCVDNLKAICEEKLSLVLTTQNVLDCLLLADSHNAVNLKQEAIDFIVQNANDIIDLPPYKSLVDLHPDVLVKIIQSLVLKQRNIK